VSDGARTTPLTTRLAPVAIVVAVGLAGCTSTTPAKRLGKEAYLRQLNEIASGYDARRATRLFDKIVVEPPQQRGSCLARTRELEQVLDRLVDRLEGLGPPEEIAQLQGQLVDASRESIRSVGEAAEEVSAGRLQCGRPMNRRIYGLPSTERAQAVLDEYAKRGYVFGLNSQD
jgi:hypothetical protein